MTRRVTEAEVEAAADVLAMCSFDVDRESAGFISAQSDSELVWNLASDSLPRVTVADDEYEAHGGTLFPSFAEAAAALRNGELPPGYSLASDSDDDAMLMGFRYADVSDAESMRPVPVEQGSWLRKLAADRDATTAAILERDAARAQLAAVTAERDASVAAETSWRSIEASSLAAYMADDADKAHAEERDRIATWHDNCAATWARHPASDDESARRIKARVEEHDFSARVFRANVLAKPTASPVPVDMTEAEVAHEFRSALVRDGQLPADAALDTTVALITALLRRKAKADDTLVFSGVSYSGNVLRKAAEAIERGDWKEAERE